MVMVMRRMRRATGAGVRSWSKWCAFIQNSRVLSPF